MIPTEIHGSVLSRGGGHDEAVVGVVRAKFLRGGTSSTPPVGPRVAGRCALR